MQRWYVVRTKPRSENVAAAELTRDGIEVFSPRVQANPTRKGQPLFPGYLFLRCDPESQGWPSFSQVHRIIGFLRFGCDTPSLSDEVIISLKEHYATANHDGGRRGRFLAGEKVHITSDPFQGLVAQVVENNTTSPNARVTVLLAFMGRMVRAQVPWQDLRRMEGQGLREAGTGRDATPKVTAPRGTRGRKRRIRHRQSS